MYTILLMPLEGRRGGLGHEVLEKREGPVAASGGGLVHIGLRPQRRHGQSECNREIGEVGALAGAETSTQRGRGGPNDERKARGVHVETSFLCLFVECCH